MPQATIGDVLRVFWEHTKPFKWVALMLILIITLASLVDVVQPLLLKELFDLFETYIPAQASFQIFLPVFAAIFGTKLLGWLAWRINGFATNRFQPAIMARLESSAFAYILEHDYQFFVNHFAGSLVKKVNRLSRAFESLADEIQFRFVPVTVVLVGGFIGLFLQKPILAFVFMFWATIFIYFNILAARWAVKIDILRASIDSELGGSLSDAISNVVTTKLFPSFTYELNRFKEVLYRYVSANTRSWDRHEVIFGVQALLMLTIEMILMYIGIQGWLQGEFSLGDIAFIQTYLMLVFGKLWEISRSLRHLYDVFADSKEMVEIMLIPHGVKDHKGAKSLKVRRGQIKFDKVQFGLDGRTILNDISFNIFAGEKVALVGPSGAGKSTITKLLFRFHDLQKGKILIDGQDIGKVTQESLRKQISLVPQDPILFHRTLMENIRYGRREATDAEVMAAAKKAHCHEFISSLVNGYDTYVGERGVKLSGGERQRVAIARAILKDAPILVLDEATSSLDSESEALIQDALHELMENKTVIIIAHRLSTIMQMDRILVIENGQMIHGGTHTELLKLGGRYQTLWNIQAGGFRV